MEREEEYTETCDILEYVGDPYDNMDLREKKTHGISLYFQIIKVFVFSRILSTRGSLQKKKNSFFFTKKRENTKYKILSRFFKRFPHNPRFIN